MDQNYQQPANPPIMAKNNMQTQNKKIGPIVAILIIVLVLIVASLYMFGSRLNKEVPYSGSAAVSSSDAEIAQTIQPVTNTSDDPQSLQNDLDQATDGIDNQNF